MRKCQRDRVRFEKRAHHVDAGHTRHHSGLRHHRRGDDEAGRRRGNEGEDADHIYLLEVDDRSQSEAIGRCRKPLRAPFSASAESFDDIEAELGLRTLPGHPHNSVAPRSRVGGRSPSAPAARRQHARPAVWRDGGGHTFRRRPTRLQTARGRCNEHAGATHNTTSGDIHGRKRRRR